MHVEVIFDIDQDAHRMMAAFNLINIGTSVEIRTCLPWQTNSGRYAIGTMVEYGVASHAEKHDTFYVVLQIDSNRVRFQHDPNYLTEGSISYVKTHKGDA